MAEKAYIGVNGVAKEVEKIYVGVNGQAKKVVKGYIGVNGASKLFFEEIPTPPPVHTTIPLTASMLSHSGGGTLANAANMVDGDISTRGNTYFSNKNKNIVDTNSGFMKIAFPQEAYIDRIDIYSTDNLETSSIGEFVEIDTNLYEKTIQKTISNDLRFSVGTPNLTQDRVTGNYEGRAYIYEITVYGEYTS